MKRIIKSCILLLCIFASANIYAQSKTIIHPDKSNAVSRQPMQGNSAENRMAREKRRQVALQQAELQKRRMSDIKSSGNKKD
ncbi:hypothetical protein [Flavihumibacter solisilvae]|uniref:Uncharacterized protein n=1 Tax=Flavihumibacter solisilvae TaxID=1349421 RepID=A0A0C1KSK6_9BACT|nr:hypothetical protein [Flavihumibacter solisilvae]KIC90667.1 hypothetical protein OI18_23270 [Flavihumibacter solisilvae]